MGQPEMVHNSEPALNIPISRTTYRWVTACKLSFSRAEVCLRYIWLSRLVATVTASPKSLLHGCPTWQQHSATQDCHILVAPRTIHLPVFLCSTFGLVGIPASSCISLTLVRNVITEVTKCGDRHHGFCYYSRWVARCTPG